ncbi:MAG: hypothetical protein ACYC63_09230 [Armatimonadota bacterium]
MTTPPTRREMIWVLLWAVLIMLLTCIPYLYGLKLADGRTFSGFIWGVDEGNVYLTWMRQAAEGDIFFRNQYAVAPENPRFFNLFLQLGGRLSGLLDLRPIILFHVLRLLGGVFLLVSFYRLTAEITRDRIARWSALTLASLGSGLGWLIVMKYPQSGLHPVDVGQGWQVQPEAITFPSLLLNGLFTTSMALMCLTFLYALRALRDNDRKAICWGGLCLLVLGNVHTYDVFPIWVALAIMAFLSFYQYRRHSSSSAPLPMGEGCPKGGVRVTLRLLTMIALGLPSVAWALYATFSDPSFLAKGLTPTPAFRFVDYAVGYGLIGALAIMGAILTLRSRPTPLEGPGTYRPAVQTDASIPAGEPLTQPAAGRMMSGPSIRLLPVVWAVANAVVLLIPVSFQRKMIEGLHLPLCILAGLAVSWLASLITTNLRRQGKHKHAMERLVLTVCAVTVFCIPSNALFVSQCLQNVKTNNEQLLGVLQPPLYLDPPTAQAMQWLGQNATRDDIIVSSSLMGSYIPTYCPAKVWIGHWAETLHFQDRLRDLDAVFGTTNPEALLTALRQRGISMVFYSQWEQALAYGEPNEGWQQAADQVLQKVYDQDGVRIYRVPQETR